uniref:Short neuropeptide F n=1 Tax=Zeugodacus cucurbitae TaxID=28588 RepID=A0A0A1WF98_ZEUCU
MFKSNHLVSSFLFVCISVMLWQQSAADVPDNTALANLYNSLLQREYAGPIVFPNHQVERKAQRSPSLRLRFGRRSDPSMPLHSEFDAVMNDLAGASNNGGITDAEEAAAYYGDEYPEDMYDAGFERMVRKPQRLRFGRSLPRVQNNIDDELEHEQLQQTDDFFNSLLTSEKLHNMLLSLRQYDAEPLSSDFMSLNHNNDDFQREVRKPSPLRLRFGRSAAGDTNEQKKVIAQNAINVEKPAPVATQQQQPQQAQAKN